MTVTHATPRRVVLVSFFTTVAASVCFTWLRLGSVDPSIMLWVHGVDAFVGVIAGLFPAGLVVAYLDDERRDGVAGFVADVFALATLSVALTVLLREVWWSTIPQEQMRSRTMEVTFGPIFVGIALLPGLSRIALRREHAERRAIVRDVLVSLVSAAAVVWYAVTY